jgi:type IV pilus assembly protein PilC
MAATKAAVRAQNQAPRNPNPMSMFVWVGTDKRGKKMKGEQLAKSANLLRADLRRQGINPTAVKPKGKSIFGNSGSRIKPREIAIFSRQLATMMQSGIPMVNAFEIIAGGQKNPRMKTMLEAIRGEIEGGSTLHEAIGKHPVQFDELYR